MFLPILKVKLLVFLLFLTLPFYNYAQSEINPKNIEIFRDNYGVPHIFSDSNAEAVYGIAWAQCEDNFELMQENLAISTGVYGKIKGKEGAILDYIVQLFEIDQHVDRRYQQDISEEIEALLQAYTKSINRYAALHPKEVILKELFPVTTKDILKGYVFNFIVMSNAVVDVAKVADNKMDLFFTGGNLRGAGSNAMAYNKNITEDGKTYLVGNPHQPIEGPASFWELSVHSKEGMDLFGVTFAAGGVSPVIASNRELGWTHTTNYEDYSDVFQLKMHPTKEEHYEYDGEWLPLEKKKAKLKVKIGPLQIPVSKAYYTSKYGPTMKNESGFYAFRSNCFYNLNFVEQWYKMGLAQNYDEFWEALEIQGLPSQTITYADGQDNILHISNGILPKRKNDQNWKAPILSTRSENRWSYEEKHALEELPFVKNPNCGYVFNCNNTPLDCTAAAENPKLENYPASFGMMTSNTLRAKRFKSLIEGKESLSFQDIRSMREDVGINKDDMGFRNFQNGGDMPAILSKYPALADVKLVFDKWDGHMNPENKQATIMALTSMYIADYLIKNYGIYDTSIPEPVIVNAFTDAKAFLLKHYKTLEVALGEVQRIGRGDKEFPMYGAPQTLANGTFEAYKKDKIICRKGDSFIMYAQFDKGGLAALQTINVFGNSNNPDSPHFNDQLEMYTKKEVKPVELDLLKIKANAVKSYHPQ